MKIRREIQNEMKIIMLGHDVNSLFLRKGLESDQFLLTYKHIILLLKPIPPVRTKDKFKISSIIFIKYVHAPDSFHKNGLKA